MRRIRSKDTKPELIVRRLVTALGYRYRLHSKKLPGKPDLSLGPRKRAIFVHGCFWHQHGDCREGRVPGSRVDYWKPKLQRNVERDLNNLDKLKEMGWDALVIWECELMDPSLPTRITRFLEGG